MTVHILPALRDNYMHLVEDKSTGEAAIVDPVNPDEVVSAIGKSGVKLTTILTTHHHWDHAGGNEQLLLMYPELNLKVCGGDDRVHSLNCKVTHNQEFKLGALSVRCLETPCHTSGHICYYITSQDQSSKAVFTGDTLFVAGCGKFFEGTAEQMYHALHEVLASLPPDTHVFCGHEYTLSNLKFAQQVEPENTAITDMIKWTQERRDKDLPSFPSTISQEMTFNPFMRVKEPTVQSYTGKSDVIGVMAELREKKNSFKPRKIKL